MNFNEMLNTSFGIKTITIDKIIENKEKKPKRICFNTTHQDACKRIHIENNSIVGALNIPFDETIKLFIESETGLRVIEKRNGKFWCPANNEEEFNKIENLVEKYKTIIFIRDTLECSIALSEHMQDGEKRTEIGELEYDAKYGQSEESTEALSKILIDFINNCRLYKETTLVCAIPPSKKGEIKLPQKLAESVSIYSHKENISEYIEWNIEKPKIKELNLDQKLNTLIDTDLTINFNVNNKNIILLDDLYQSGITMQYVAMKLKEAGAKKIFGISIVKSRRDTDNI